MAEQNATLSTFYGEWKRYQDKIKDALTPLTAEQLALCAVSDLRSIGEIATHLVGTRVGWFSGFLGEPGEIERWHAPGAPPKTAAELTHGFEASWTLIANALVRWSPDDMQQTFGRDWHGDRYELSRSWVVWHVLEHDLHHGGEISLTLGMHGLQAPDI
jgi:uncharacterized damage-inducible protein DinB